MATRDHDEVRGDVSHDPSTGPELSALHAIDASLEHVLAALRGTAVTPAAAAEQSAPEHPAEASSHDRAGRADRAAEATTATRSPGGLASTLTRPFVASAEWTVGRVANGSLRAQRWGEDRTRRRRRGTSPARSRQLFWTLVVLLAGAVAVFVALPFLASADGAPDTPAPAVSAAAHQEPPGTAIDGREHDRTRPR